MPVECVKLVPIRGFMGQNNETTVIKVTNAILYGVNGCIQRRTNGRLCSAKNINCQMEPSGDQTPAMARFEKQALCKSDVVQNNTPAIHCHYLRILHQCARLHQAQVRTDFLAIENFQPRAIPGARRSGLGQ